MEWVNEARTYVTQVLKKLPKDAWEACRETTIDIICDELQKMPVPIVGTLLSKIFRKAVSGKSPNPSPPAEILDTLVRMQESDDNFLRGLGELGENIDHLSGTIEFIRADLAAIREDLTIPLVHFSDPVLTLNYPVSDNELQFGLMNRGGGIIKVPEIELLVESYEPELAVDYSVPMAPPQYLRLKVRLSPGTMLYPLLKLNDEPFRRFGQKGEGAEEICIQMSSNANARYHVRVRIPFVDEISGKHGASLYPPEGEQSLLIPFRFAPGWSSDITPESMLDRAGVLSEILNTLSTVASILEKARDDDPDGVDEELRKAGISLGLYRYPYVAHMIHAFIGPLSQLSLLENRPDTLGIVLGVVHQLLRFPPRGAPIELPSTEEFSKLTTKSELAMLITLFLEEQDEARRKNILEQVMSGMAE
jgi:hypothetical protein